VLGMIFFLWEREGMRHAPSRLGADVEDSIRGMIFFVLLLYGFDSIEGIFGCYELDDH